MPVMSVIIPAYNEQESVAHVLPALHSVLDAAAINFEVVFIDDGSTDDTYKEICAVCKSYGGASGGGGGASGGSPSGGASGGSPSGGASGGGASGGSSGGGASGGGGGASGGSSGGGGSGTLGRNRVRGYRLSRNFGKEAAIWAGLQNAAGDCCVVMDCDLQHPPEVLPQMYKLWDEGFEIVEGIKSGRGRESIFHKAFAGLFYALITGFSGIDMKTSSDFKLLDRRVVEELLQFKERNSFFRGLSFWVGFRSTKLEYDVAPRLYGKTKWGLFSLIKYAFNNIVGFSTAPMQLVTIIGTILVLVSAALGIQTLVRYILGYSLEGFTTIILLLLFIGGGLMISLGIIGLYIAKIYEEVKGRPRYIICESTEE